MFSDHPQYLMHLEELIENHILNESYDVWLRLDVFEMVIGKYVPSFGRACNLQTAPLASRIHWWDRCVEHVAANIHSKDAPTEFCTKFLNPLVPLFCKFGSGMTAILQHAISWGYDDIVLLGCDTDYKVDLTGAGDPNHFSKDYHPAGFWDKEAVDIHDAGIRYSHSLTAEWATANGIRIRNASGGNLEAYERTTLDAVLDSR